MGYDGSNQNLVERLERDGTFYALLRRTTVRYLEEEQSACITMRNRFRNVHLTGSDARTTIVSLAKHLVVLPI